MYYLSLQTLQVKNTSVWLYLQKKKNFNKSALIVNNFKLFYFTYKIYLIKQILINANFKILMQ